MNVGVIRDDLAPEMVDARAVDPLDVIIGPYHVSTVGTVIINRINVWRRAE